jgi:signal peptidase
MEPAFHRGDLLFLINPPNLRYETGDITVYKIPGQDIPIVHRILETHDVVKTVKGSVFRMVTHGWRSAHCHLFCSVRETEPRPKNQLLLTKGDNNYLDDVELYQGLDWLERKHIVGKVRG